MLTRTNKERRNSIDLMCGYAKTRRERQGRVPPRGFLPWPHGHARKGESCGGARRRGGGGGLGGGGGGGGGVGGLDAAGLLAMMGLLGLRAAKGRARGGRS